MATGNATQHNKNYDIIRNNIQIIMLREKAIMIVDGRMVCYFLRNNLQPLNLLLLRECPIVGSYDSDNIGISPRPSRQLFLV